jgi:hypothetical protein
MKLKIYLKVLVIASLESAFTASLSRAVPLLGELLP